MNPCPNYLRSGHSHDDPDTVTFGCPRCVERVQRDQESAAFKAAPLRSCRVTFRSYWGDSFTTTMQLRCPTGWEGWQIEEWQPEEFGVGISAWCAKHTEDFQEWLSATASISVGAIVTEKHEPEPSLFGDVS